MKILVTGGAGFIGSEFVRQGIKRGYDISVIDKLTYAGDLTRIEIGKKKEIPRFYLTDINNREFLDFIFMVERPYIVIHFAAESHVDRSIYDPSPFIETNIKGTQALLDLAVEYEVKHVVNISTDEVYGDLDLKGRFTEESPLKPNSPYSVSKTSQDMMGRAYMRTYGLQVTTLRMSNNFGPWQHPEKLIPLAIWRAMNNQKIPVYAKGENIREWIYVSDCVDAILGIIEKAPVGGTWNIGSGEERKNIYIVKKILEIMKKPESLIQFVEDRPGHDFRYALNCNKIENEIGWKATTKFEDGLEKTIEWYIKNKKWLANQFE